MKKGLCVIIFVFALVGILCCKGERESEEVLEDGCYHIEKMYEDKMSIKKVDSSIATKTFIVPLSDKSEISIYGIEPLTEMPVQCTYDELVSLWKAEKTYDLHFIFEEEIATLVTIKEHSETDKCFKYVADGELGQLFYTIEFAEENEMLKLVPIKYVSSSESADMMDLNVANVIEENDVYVCISYPEKQRQVFIDEEARFYVLYPNYAVRCTKEEILEKYHKNATFRVFLDNNNAVCIILYDIS